MQVETIIRFLSNNQKKKKKNKPFVFRRLDIYVFQSSNALKTNLIFAKLSKSQSTTSMFLRHHSSFHLIFLFTIFFLSREALLFLHFELFCLHHRHLPPMMRIVVIFISLFIFFYLCFPIQCCAALAKSIKKMWIVGMGHFCSETTACFVFWSVCVCVHLFVASSWLNFGEKHIYSICVFIGIKQLSENSQRSVHTRWPYT